MAILYRTIQFQAALRTGELQGTNQATLEAAYTGLFTAALDGGNISLSGYRDIILLIEKELAHVIASDKQQPYRNHLYGRSLNLANLAQIPTLSNVNKEFIGVFDSVRDATDHQPLTEHPVQIIDDISDSFFDDIELYHFNLFGGRISHTRTDVYFEGCVWDLATQLTAYAAADGESPLPQVLANTWIEGVCANLPPFGNWTVALANKAAQYYQIGIQNLRNRELSQPIMPDNRSTGATAS